MNLISIGGVDGEIVSYDTRVGSAAFTLSGGSTVCGLRWNMDGSFLASGGNSDTLSVWDIRALRNSTEPFFFNTDHKSAVKAIAWSHVDRGKMVTGGGVADRNIKLWDVARGVMISSKDTLSQVCAIEWSRIHACEIVSSHGFSGHNVTLWDVDYMCKMLDVMSHRSRVLHMTQSPCGQYIATAAGGEDGSLVISQMCSTEKRARKRNDPKNIVAASMEHLSGAIR
jgi:cell division cycle protein 20 (cofactor of APC complex)